MTRKEVMTEREFNSFYRALKVGTYAHLFVLVIVIVVKANGGI